MNKKNSGIATAVTRAALLGGCATLSLAAAGPALAQEDQVDRDRTLEVVVVSAERRETTLQQTPLSIQAFSEEGLEVRNIQNVEDLASYVPGFSAGGDPEGGSFRPIFVIRGIGQTSGRDTIERGVGLYVDDIFLPRTTGSYLQLLDVERVEVLKGPQGTLFGRNSTGGAIRYVTRKPTDEFEGSVSGTTGSFGRLDVQGLVNVPLSDKVAMRAQFGSFSRDGFLRSASGNDDRGDQNDIVARAAFRVWANEDVTIDAGISYQKAKSFSPPLKVTAFTPFSPHGAGLNAQFVAAGLPALTVNDPRIVLSDPYEWSGECYVGQNNAGIAVNDGASFFGHEAGYCNDYGVFQENIIGFVDVNWQLSDRWALRSVSGYVDGLTDATTDWAAMGTYYTHEKSVYDSLSQELQLSYSGDRLHAVGGVYYFNENPVLANQNRNILFVSIPPLGVSLGDCCFGFNRVRDQETESYGVFGQVTFDVTDALTLILGGRFTSDEKDITVWRSNRPAGAPGTPVSANDSWDSTNYRVTGQYQFTDDLMVYGTASTGFKAGGFNDGISPTLAVNDGVVPFDPEDVSSYELGIRSQWFDRSLTVNLTAFSSDYENLQLTTPVLQTVNGILTTSLVIANAGQVDLSGIELDARWRATDALTFDAALATLDLNYGSLLPGSALLETATCSDPGAPTLETCNVQDLARAPALQYSLGANYLLPLEDHGDVMLSANYSWTDEQETSSSSQNSIRLESYGTLNLRAEYTPQDANWSVSVFGTNVAGEEYYTSGTEFMQFYGTITAAPGRPAEWGVRLKAEF